VLVPIRFVAAGVLICCCYVFSGVDSGTRSGSDSRICPSWMASGSLASPSTTSATPWG
jgi:hypothetical protein